jgi:hypothetical protein
MITICFGRLFLWDTLRVTRPVQPSSLVIIDSDSIFYFFGTLPEDGRGPAPKRLSREYEASRTLQLHLLPRINLYSVHCMCMLA